MRNEIINGYAVSYEKARKCWTAKVNGLTICACATLNATKLNAEFVLNSPFAKHITQKQGEAA